MYLTVVIDLYSRAVVGWSMNSTMATKLLLDAMMAVWRRRPKTPVMIHSDWPEPVVIAEMCEVCTRGCSGTGAEQRVTPNPMQGTHRMTAHKHGSVTIVKYR